MFSCNKQADFTVKGTVDGGQDSIIYLGKRGLSSIDIIDSAKIGNNGQFELKGLPHENPDLYILRLNNQIINLSIDSTETVTVESSLKKFAADYNIEGSEESVKIKNILSLRNNLERSLNELEQKYNNNSITEESFLEQAIKDINEYKEKIKIIIISNLKSPAAYFALFQKINDVLILDPYDKNDSKMYTAVATSWDLHYKGSARAEHLKTFALSALKEIKSSELKSNLLDEITEVDESSLFNIELPDINNKIIRLSSLKGKPVILDFLIYQTEDAPVHNIALNKIYEKYKPNIEIYQVSFDADLHFWQNASVNLPWISVRDNDPEGSNIIGKFNIQGFPTTFLLNSNGEIIKRITSANDLETELKKLL